MVRYYIIFTGRVQGVGFRYAVYRWAMKYSVTGWIANRYDGSVEAELQGEAGFFHKILKELNNDRFIRIEDYSLKEIDVIPNEKNFRIAG